MPVSSCRRLTLAVAATVAAVVATAGPAMASGTAAGCPAAVTSNPFTPWGDDADYQLAPAGDVEDSGASWSLTGGARAVEGNETSFVSSPGDHRSMRLPGVASATTARMCIGVEHPTFRFFAKRDGGPASSRLNVSVVYDDADGNEITVPAGEVSASGDWAPSQPLPTVVNELAAAQGNAIGVSFRFQPQGGGVWSIDDVFVDPHRMGR